MRIHRLALGLGLCCGLLAACAPVQRMGMVVDPATGLQFGSINTGNLVFDSSQFSNRKLKVRFRNTSGDGAFDLGTFQAQIEAALAAKGYEPTAADADDFGILFDVNVYRSDQVTQTLAQEFAFLGAAAGGIAGAQRGGGADLAAGALAGVTLGTVAGSYVAENTYIVVADVTIGIVNREEGVRETVLQFGAGEPEREREPIFQGFDRTISIEVAVFAGGRNVAQATIAGEVRQRFVRILSDVL